MASKRERRMSRMEQGERDTEIRRETEIRGAMGVPPSGAESSRPNPEQARGDASEPVTRARREGRLPLPD